MVKKKYRIIFKMLKNLYNSFYNSLYNSFTFLIYIILFENQILNCILSFVYNYGYTIYIDITNNYTCGYNFIISYIEKAVTVNFRIRDVPFGRRNRRFHSIFQFSSSIKFLKLFYSFS